MNEIEIKKANIEALPIYTPYENPHLKEFVEKRLKGKSYIKFAFTSINNCFMQQNE